MTFVELFAGIGGFSVGFERAGMDCVGHVEIDPYAQAVLRKHWPNVSLYPDILEVKGDEFGQIDLVCGGFPCQDISCAGKQEGIAGRRSGLFFEAMRIVSVCRPRWVVLENVPGILARAEWMGAVLGEFARLGYDAEWEVISAADVGAPHLRKRVWIAAYSSGEQVGIAGQSRECPNVAVADTDGGGQQSKRIGGLFDGIRSAQQDDIDGRHSEMAHPSSPRLEERQGISGNPCEKRQATERGGLVADASRELFDRSGDAGTQRGAESSNGRWWTAEPSVRELAHGFSVGLVRYAGRVAKGIPNRTAKLRCLGNSLIPQIAEIIGRRIMSIEYDS